MPSPTVEVTPNVLAKAQRLIEQHCMWPITLDPGRCWVGVVEGDTARYLVTVVAAEHLPLGDSTAPSAAASCQCERFRHGSPCSHTVAAGLLVDRSAAEVGQEVGPMLAGLPPSPRRCDYCQERHLDFAADAQAEIEEGS